MLGISARGLCLECFSERGGYLSCISERGLYLACISDRVKVAVYFGEGLYLPCISAKGVRLACISERWNFLACISERMLYLACISDRDFTLRVSRSEGLLGVDLGERAILGQYLG